MNKQQQFEKVKQLAPDSAEFISEMAVVFGKHAAVGVKVDDEVILNTGGWQKPRKELLRHYRVRKYEQY